MLANIIDRELLRSWLSLKLLSRLDAHGQKMSNLFNGNVYIKLERVIQ